LLYCHAAGLVVEVDGPIHEANVEYDRERDAVIAARGLKILRFRNDQIRHNLREVLAAITLARQQST
jgi:very-short-patch-repair endonuclease